MSILSNLGILAYFKYTGFFVEITNNILGTDLQVHDYLADFSNSLLGTTFDISAIILPVGISFFTFQSLSYTFDVYRKRMSPVRNIIDFGFDELQFDYIRFPSDGKIKNIVYPFYDTQTEKYEIIGGFFSKLSRDLKEYRSSIILSADLFGYLATQFQSFDIGVYPLPKDEWVLGKTGFKTIQYMSVGVPAVVSDIGANKIIIEDGINGFLAQTQDEWVEKLANLIEDSALRMRISLAGRRKVEEKYSLKVSAPKFLEIMQRVYNENNKGNF